MNALEHILIKQREWALNRGLDLVGSQIERGRKLYCQRLEENLFQPLHPATRAEIESGDGKELGESVGIPKMHALHSSSALGVNLFDPWRTKEDLAPLTNACGLSRASTPLHGILQFAAKLPIDSRFPHAPNLDIVIHPESRSYQAFGIECKFSEPWSSWEHGGLAARYFALTDLWESLPNTLNLARRISPDDSEFQHLHAAQLIKHLLGLTRAFGPGGFRLFYGWYDVCGEEGARHRLELSQFTEVLRADNVAFHTLSWQELIARLSAHRYTLPQYIQYLTGRYL
jgi:hypothetical protein